jgi:stage V sporulation protein AC
LKQIQTKKDYQEFVNQKSPNSPIFKNCINAFLIGGLICSIGQIIFDFCKYRGLDTEISNTIVSILLIGISAFLTGLNVAH